MLTTLIDSNRLTYGCIIIKKKRLFYTEKII